jgi:predicted RND superfamily exporter protein
MSKKSKAKKSADAPAPEINRDWEHEDNARTVIRAQEILNDPDKMKGVKKHLKKQKNAIRSVQDIISYRNEKYGAKSKDSEEYDEKDQTDSGLVG